MLERLNKNAFVWLAMLERLNEQMTCTLGVGLRNICPLIFVLCACIIKTHFSYFSFVPWCVCCGVCCLRCLLRLGFAIILLENIFCKLGSEVLGEELKDPLRYISLFLSNIASEWTSILSYLWALDGSFSGPRGGELLKMSKIWDVLCEVYVFSIITFGGRFFRLQCFFLLSIESFFYPKEINGFGI